MWSQQHYVQGTTKSRDRLDCVVWATNNFLWWRKTPFHKILVSPAHVTISGPTEARVGDPVPLTCTTANSNPPAEIKWMVAGRQVRNATSRTVVSPEGGWITTSNITAVVEPNRRSLVVICHGLNMQLTENVVSTHTINVLCEWLKYVVWVKVR